MSQIHWLGAKPCFINRFKGNMLNFLNTINGVLNVFKKLNLEFCRRSGHIWLKVKNIFPCNDAYDMENVS